MKKIVLSLSVLASLSAFADVDTGADISEATKDKAPTATVNAKNYVVDIGGSLGVYGAVLSNRDKEKEFSGDMISKAKITFAGKGKADVLPDTEFGFNIELHANPGYQATIKEVDPATILEKGTIFEKTQDAYNAAVTAVKDNKDPAKEAELAAAETALKEKYLLASAEYSSATFNKTRLVNERKHYLEHKHKDSLVNADEVYMYIKNKNTGSVYLGNVKSTALTMAMGAPSKAGTGLHYGVWSDVMKTHQSGEGRVSTPYIVSSGKSLKMAVYTPRMAGLQIGASFAPQPRAGNFFNRDKRRLNNQYFHDGTPMEVDDFKNFYDIGANYVKYLSNGLMVGLSANYSHAHVGSSIDDAKYNTDKYRYSNLNAYGFGSRLSYEGFTLGANVIFNGRYGNANEKAGKKLDNNKSSNAYIVGAQYEQGPFVVGASFTRRTGAGNTEKYTKKNTADLYSFGLTYKLAEGFDIMGEVTHQNYKGKYVEAEKKYTDTDKNTAFILGARMTF
jgi:hypothetical protein